MKLYVEVRITGGGTPSEIAESLRNMANDIETDYAINYITTKGEYNFEDPTLFGEFGESEEEDFE